MLRRQQLVLALAALALAASSLTEAFLVAPTTPTTQPAVQARSGRGAVLMRAEAGQGVERRAAVLRSLGLGGLAVAVAAGVAPLKPAAANVGEGGLPEVTEAFQRVLKGQKDWGKIGQTIAEREGKLGDDEWVNTQIFLRNSYMVGEDMRRVVRDAEPDKRAKGTEIAKEFQRLTLDMDKPTKSKDYQAFLAAHQKGAQAFQDFLDVLNDVPDEL